MMDSDHAQVYVSMSGRIRWAGEGIGQGGGSKGSEIPSPLVMAITIGSSVSSLDTV